MQLLKRKGKWTLYDDEGWILVITSSKKVALWVWQDRNKTQNNGE